MSLNSLPTELLLNIVEMIPANQADQLAGLVRTNGRLHDIAARYLYTEETIMAATWYATRKDKVDCLLKAIERKASLLPASRGKPFTSSLVNACRNGSINVAKLIVQMFPEMLDEDMEDHGMHALSAAAATGQSDVVSWLLGIPTVDVNRLDSFIRTPMSWACYSGNKKVVEVLLLRHDVNVNSIDHDRRTPIELAYDNNRIEVMETLLRDHRLDLTFCHENMLALSVTEGNHEAVRLLLSFYDSCDVFWNIWAYMALRTAIIFGLADMIKHFSNVRSLDINATPSQYLPHVSFYPPILWTAIRRPGSHWKYLLDFHNLDMNIGCPGVDGTPLIAAMRAHRNSLGTTLIERGCLLNQKDNTHGYTALMWAVICDNEPMVKLLLSREDIDLSVKDNNGIPVLCHVTCTTGRKFDIMKLFLDHPDVDVNISNNDGMTPLMLAVKNYRYTAAYLLVEKGGIDYSLQDNEGKTVSDHASRGTRRRRFATLIRAGMRNRIRPRLR
jgi:ankyrin repeat protein